MTSLTFSVYNESDLSDLSDLSDRITLTKDVIKIGRIKNSHICLDGDPRVARMHAVIEVEGPDAISLIDLGSSEPSRVNGAPVSRSPLRAGDQIQIGGTTLLLERIDGEEMSISAPQVRSPSPLSAQRSAYTSGQCPQCGRARVDHRPECPNCGSMLAGTETQARGAKLWLPEQEEAHMTDDSPISRLREGARRALSGRALTVFMLVSITSVLAISIPYLSSCALSLTPTVIKISPASGPQCRAELVSALNAHAEQSGLAFEATEEHAGSILATGTVAIPYPRDGVQHTVSFGATMPEETCLLTFYKRERQEAGSYQSRLGNFASVVLSECQCERPTD